ncbi:hypothetical protein HMPREF9412_1862 [Paenibacillus sp. HGF5]|nr:hypothetical protein HMPREF9412_1862 [Paenibacillus sp. HGF5]
MIPYYIIGLQEGEDLRMGRNMKKLLLLGLIVLSVAGMSACGGSGLSENEREQIVNQVEKLETAEYKLLHFQMDYPEYLAEVDGIVSESYMQAMSDRIIFGYNEKEYRASDMMEMSAEEFEKHKEYMRGLVKSMGMNEEKSSIRISAPYKSEQSGEVFIYASESRELKGKTLTQMNRRYSLDKTEGAWIITAVEQDKVTIGSDGTETDAEAKLDALKYRTHEGADVQYRDNILTFKGWE